MLIKVGPKQTILGEYWEKGFLRSNLSKFQFINKVLIFCF